MPAAVRVPGGCRSGMRHHDLKGRGPALIKVSRGPVRVPMPAARGGPGKAKLRKNRGSAQASSPGIYLLAMQFRLV